MRVWGLWKIQFWWFRVRIRELLRSGLRLVMERSTTVWVCLEGQGHLTHRLKTHIIHKVMPVINLLTKS